MKSKFYQAIKQLKEALESLNLWNDDRKRTFIRELIEADETYKALENRLGKAYGAYFWGGPVWQKEGKWTETTKVDYIDLHREIAKPTRDELQEWLGEHNLKGRCDGTWKKTGTLRNGEAYTRCSQEIEVERDTVKVMEQPFEYRVRLKLVYYRPGFPTKHCKVETSSYQSVVCELPQD